MPAGRKRTRNKAKGQGKVKEMSLGEWDRNMRGKI